MREPERTMRNKDITVTMVFPEPFPGVAGYRYMEGTTPCCWEETHRTLDICVPCSFNTEHQFLVPKSDFCQNRDQCLTPINTMRWSL